MPEESHGVVSNTNQINGVTGKVYSGLLFISSSYFACAQIQCLSRTSAQTPSHLIPNTLLVQSTLIGLVQK